MATINLETKIHAPAKTCFDLARSADAHVNSMQDSKEKVVAGRSTGLFELNDVVTWEANHLGIRQHLTVKITKMEPYVMFEDVMVKGAFKKMQHQHYFEQQGDYTIMRDVFAYEVPGWVFGRMFDALVLKSYMARLLTTRNESLKRSAENIIG
jgi:ligand-binding SRPBCC domain-containing protein